MVQAKGMREAPGTWLSADFDSTSWKVIPANSGVVTERSTLVRSSRPGSAAASTSPTFCPCHLIKLFEHMNDDDASDNAI